MKNTIYTKKGDTGTTTSWSGKTYRKDDSVIEINGVIDETMASLEKVKYYLSEEQDPLQHKQISKIIEALYLLGAEISAGKVTDLPKYIDKEYVDKLEYKIDEMDIKIDTFMTFNTIQGIDTSEARTRVRRLERRLTSLFRRGQIRGSVYAYLNRLSDYLFVLSVYLERLYTK